MLLQHLQGFVLELVVGLRWAEVPRRGIQFGSDVLGGIGNLQQEPLQLVQSCKRFVLFNEAELCCFGWRRIPVCVALEFATVPYQLLAVPSLNTENWLSQIDASAFDGREMHVLHELANELASQLELEIPLSVDPLDLLFSVQQPFLRVKHC